MTATRNRPVTVVAVDDQEVFRGAVRSLIAAMPGFEHVGEACSGREALELIPDLHPDIVLLDVRMPEMDGLETSRRLMEAGSDALIVLVSLDEVPSLPARLADVGATAYLRKQDLSTRSLGEIWDEHGRQSESG
jgi:two-component system nitrate/nitrite response regulator NarL